MEEFNGIIEGPLGKDRFSVAAWRSFLADVRAARGRYADGLGLLAAYENLALDEIAILEKDGPPSWFRPGTDEDLAILEAGGTLDT